MSNLRIAEVAQRSGVPATTLRYNEQIGLLKARRSDNGYRSYNERDIERLAFITRAKQLDISLDDLVELVAVWDNDDCSPVAQRMGHAVDVRLRETQARVDGLQHLVRELAAAAARLSRPTKNGPCDSDCACMKSGAAEASPMTAQGPPIACSLASSEAIERRTRDWQSVLTGAVARTSIPDGVAVYFDGDRSDVAELARLAFAEQACCPFFTFALHIDSEGVRLDVRAPSDATNLIEQLFGPAA